MHTLSPFWKDALERILFTAIAAALAAGSVYVTNLPGVYVPVGTVVLTVLKTLVAAHVGNPNTASLIKGDTA